MNRFTFVVQVHPEGISTLENLSTHELIRVSDLDAVGPQIVAWLAEQESARSGAPQPAPPHTGRARRGSAPA